MLYQEAVRKSRELYSHLTTTVADRLGREWLIDLIACRDQTTKDRFGWVVNGDRVKIRASRDHRRADGSVICTERDDEIYNLSPRAHADAHTVAGLTPEQLVAAVVARVRAFDGGDFESAGRLCSPHPYYRAVAAWREGLDPSSRAKLEGAEAVAARTTGKGRKQARRALRDLEKALGRPEFAA